MMHGHYASITFLDRQIGRLLDALQARRACTTTPS